MKNLTIVFFNLVLVLWSAQGIAQPGGPNNGPNDARPLGDAPVPDENPITESKRVLGKILFWDEQLSSDNTVACGTCHKPAAGGGDTRLAINPGFDMIFGTADDVTGSPGIRALDENGLQINDPVFGHGAQVTGRATPSFLTSMFADSNFWDGRATDEFVDPLNPDSIIIESGGALESQAIGPILSTIEMAQQGRDWADVTDKLAQLIPLALASNIPADMADALQGDANYPALFQSAFGDNAITPVRIGMAIATYERTLVPNQTPWDQYVAGDSTAMTADQIAGWEAFDEQTPCGNCHRPPLFSDDNFRNIGLRPAIEDLGRFDVSGRNQDRGEFRTPSLRNTGLKQAMMHVGWITDVADAIDFYNAGTNNTGHIQFTQNQSGIPNSNLDIDEIDVFGNDPVRRNQVIDFIANGLTDPRVANESFPFDRPTLASELISESAVLGATIAGATSDSSATTASFVGSVASNDGGTNRRTFSTNETLAINMQINIASADTQSSGNIYCLVSYEGAFYGLNPNGNYVPWNGNPDSLPVARFETVLGDIQQMAIVEQFTQTRGEFAVFVGYDTADGVIRYNSNPVQFVVN